MPATAQQLADVFNEADWPMFKEEVVDHAERSTDDESVLRAVRSLPRGSYAKLEDVIAGVDTPDTPAGNH